MNLPSLILILAVHFVLIAWLSALNVATKLEFGEDSTKRQKTLIEAAALFALIVAFHLIVGATGVASNFDRFPPPFALYFIFNVLVVPGFMAFSKFGTLIAKHISYQSLVGFHSFRILAEFTIFTAVLAGIAPVQMSFEGYNPDLITGFSALILFFVLKRRPSLALVKAFNYWGVFALLVIGFIAVTSMPVPVRLFMNEPSNIWVTMMPYTLLPGVLVAGALSGHLILFRKLSMQRKRTSAEIPPTSST